MRITSFGHSAYLLEIQGRGSDRPFRLLADPWLSDYVIGDLMARFPRLRFEAEALLPLDAIFISHAHTDHLDPYTLVRLHRELPRLPPLVLPQSLTYLRGLFEEYLPGAELVFLEHEQPLELQGVRLAAFFNPETEPTNEDDVMVLVARGGRDVFLGEADALLPLYDPEARAWVASLLEAGEGGTAVFHTTRNELEATLAMLAVRTLEERRDRIGRSLETLTDEIHRIFAPPSEEWEEDDLWSRPGLVRLIGGQGMAFPREVDPRWNRVLFPIRVEDRVRLEREAAEGYGHTVAVEAFEAGKVHRFEGGRLVARESYPGLSLLDQEEERRFDPDLPLFEDFPCAPIDERPRDRGEQCRRILDALNRRFLPRWIGARRPPVEHVLAGRGGEYRIRVRFGSSGAYEDRDYRVGFDALRFAETDVRGEPDEFYWANDIEDVLSGRADEFSTFPRRPLPGRSLAFWNTLGLPYLNNDLVERKLRFHFERARRGGSVDSWVLPFYEPLRR